MTFIRLGLLVALAFDLPSAASALQLCVAQRGEGIVKEGAPIRLRASCRPREIALPISLEEGGATVRLTGVNLQIVDGSGDTEGEPNGRGNLIVGYDEGRCIEDGAVVGHCAVAGACAGSGMCDLGQKTGSHNVVVGPGHRYPSVGGFVAGSTNAVTAAAATVVGGLENVASGALASVGGGQDNRATGDRSVVSGGLQNRAVSEYAAVAGGVDNGARAAGAVVCGGEGNVASGYAAVAVGGQENSAAGDHALVCGGAGRAADDPFAVVCGAP